MYQPSWNYVPENWRKARKRWEQVWWKVQELFGYGHERDERLCWKYFKTNGRNTTDTRSRTQTKRLCLQCYKALRHKGTHWNQEWKLDANMLEVTKVLAHLEIEVTVTDVKRLGKAEAPRSSPRSILFTVQTPWDKRKILLSALKLNLYRKQVFISPDLNVAEATLESRAFLKKKRAPWIRCTREQAETQKLEAIHANWGEVGRSPTLTIP